MKCLHLPSVLSSYRRNASTPSSVRTWQPLRRRPSGGTEHLVNIAMVLQSQQSESARLKVALAKSGGVRLAVTKGSTGKAQTYCSNTTLRRRVSWLALLTVPLGVSVQWSLILGDESTTIRKRNATKANGVFD